jgi:vacuolar-type H+-ATPase subunit E/Vma4
MFISFYDTLCLHVEINIGFKGKSKTMALESSDKKVKEICDLLYKETILPAKEESEQRILDAKKHAEEIIFSAKEQAKAIFEEGEKKLAGEKKIYEATLELAITRALEVLKAGVMNLLNGDLLSSLKATLSEKQVCKNIVSALLEGIKKDGINADLRLQVSKHVDFDELADALIGQVFGRLEKGDIPIESGVALTIKDKKITLKVTEETIKELLALHLPQLLKIKVFA